MEHVVFFPGPDGSQAFRRTATLEDAVRFVEHLRNVEDVAEVAVFALSEVPLAFRPYYRVEVPNVEVPNTEGPNVEVPNVEVPNVEAPAAEAPNVDAPAVVPPPSTDDLVPEPVEAAAGEPQLVEVPELAGVPLVPAARTIPDPAESNGARDGMRGMGFFAS